MIRSALGPRIKLTGVDDDLPCGVLLEVRPVHGTRRRAFEIDAFGRVTAAVAGTLEFVFRGFPVRRAAQMRAAGEDHKQAVRLAHHPNPVLLFEALVNARLEIRGVTDFENRAGLEKRARKEEAQEHQEIRAQESRYAAPDQAPSHLARR